MTKIAESVIRWCFYLLFFLVPLVFFAGSFELFEYNKMMLTYAFTIVVAAAWLFKIVTSARMTSDKSLFLGTIRRTPLDIPILLYLGSHVLSTLFSIDPHTSLWGYYSRYHEGLLATISYILLYYAAVSNLDRKDILRIFFYSFASGVIVTLWGALEHFGASPSCQMITGKFNDDCWIQDVRNRVFATLGQPNWMAAYLDVLILIGVGLMAKFTSPKETAQIVDSKQKSSRSQKTTLFSIDLSLLTLISTLFFFAALLFTKSRSGILGLLCGLALFAGVFLWHKLKASQVSSLKYLLILSLGMLAVSFLFGLPFSQLEKFSLEKMLGNKYQSAEVKKPQADAGYIDIGISESGDIRKIVWKGAVKVWQRYPIFGSGVETFAYAYYKDRPVEHNMVSEWDFLYNKAHNEFLNILATTGTVGMLTYLSIIVMYTLWFLRNLMTKNDVRSTNDYIIPALFAAFVSILVTNFFGFSVVIIGLFFFLIPAFSLILTHSTDPQPASMSSTQRHSALTLQQWVVSAFIVFIALIALIRLWNMWQADKSFAYGKNLNGVQHYTEAFPYLNEAVNKNPDEPTFRDELSYNEAVLASALFQQATGSAQEKLTAPYGGSNVSASTFVQKAVADSNKVVEISPNILTFWKTRTKVFYQLASLDKQYLLEALNSIQKAMDLAPTDAKVHYNYGLLLGQSGQLPAAIKIMEETTAMKADYADAHYALGLYFAEAGQKQKAKEQMEYMLKRIGNDERAKKWLEENK